jgi:hypothetical protein
MRASRNPSYMALSGLLVLVLLLLPRPGYGQETVTTELPSYQSASPPQPEEPCPKGKRGGAIGGIVVGSVFWWLLPMSIPVLITQARKLKAHNRAQLERRCQYAPRP